MIYRKLDESTVDIYLEYLKEAMTAEPEKMMCDVVDEKAVHQRIKDPFFANTTSLLAIDVQRAVGRIEYHFYGCMQDGFKMAYIDWVYVLPQYRRRGVARELFREFERECVRFGIDQYYLIESEEAEAFYSTFQEAERLKMPLLRKCPGGGKE